jgi:hypothetical protein
MSQKLVAVAFLMFSLVTWANGKVGNGSGGVVADGNYLTLPEAHIEIEGHLMLEVPALSVVVQGLSDLHLSVHRLSALLPVLYPSSQRTYYRINSLPPQAMQELKKIYSDLLKLPPEKVVIFAVTDTASNKTFLLPEYFKLNEDQQASVLFHEWLWTVNKHAVYSDVVYGENLFYQFRHDHTQYFALVDFLSQMLDDPRLILNPAFYFSGGNLQAGQVFSPEVMSCLKKNTGNLDHTRDVMGAQTCLYQWGVSLLTLPSPNDLQRGIAHYVSVGGQLSWDSDPDFFKNDDWGQCPLVFDDFEGTLSLKCSSGLVGKLSFL